MDNNAPRQNEANLSASWLKKFELLRSIGVEEQSFVTALKGDSYQQLGLGNKLKISFNFLAFLFGALYYFSKSMWQKGAFILGVSFVYILLLSIVEVGLGTTFPNVIFWIPISVFCAQMANYDYFLLVTKQEKMWAKIPDIFATTAVAIAFPVSAFVLSILFLSML